MMTGCVYLGDEQQGKLGDNGNQLYDCLYHGSCTVDGDPVLRASCEHCKEIMPRDRKHFAYRFRDHLRVFDRNLDRTDALRDMIKGCPAFLYCGGPSADELPLDRLAERGVFSLAVNNVAGFGKYGPNAFVCSDPPSKFCDGIWMDPRIMKIVPTPKLMQNRGKLRRKRDTPHVVKCGRRCKGPDCKRPGCDGKGNRTTMFDPLKIGKQRMSVCHAPNVWGFERRSWMTPDDSFFLLPTASWGNHNEGVARTGEQKTVCTMLLGMRLLYYLGARTIFMIGVDFTMSPHKGPTGNYSFGEERTTAACDSNNGQFKVVNGWMCKMVEDGVFNDFGLSIYNCNPNSGLRAFAHVPFDMAIMEAKKNLPDEPYSLDKWYEK